MGAPHRREVHVIPLDGAWAIKVDGKLFAADLTSTFMRKADAIAVARDFCQGVELATLKIHGKDGRILSEWTYPRASDPYPPKG